MYGNMEASGTDGSSEEEDDDDTSNLMHDGDGNYHDAPNDLHDEVDEDTERALSGALSESSGNLGSDIFDYKVKTSLPTGVRNLSLVVVRDEFSLVNEKQLGL